MPPSTETTVWRLVEGLLSLEEFESWVYESDSLEAEVGSDVYLALLESAYDDVEKVLETLRPWWTRGLTSEWTCRRGGFLNLVS
jgi:hypothetical protein